MVALGGDINVLPEVLSLRLGLAYETERHADAGYERLDFMPMEAHGRLVRCDVPRIEGFELSLAFMHLHWFNRTVCPRAEAQVTRARSPLGVGTVVNAGDFTAKANILSLALAYRFD